MLQLSTENLPDFVTSHTIHIDPDMEEILINPIGSEEPDYKIESTENGLKKWLVEIKSNEFMSISTALYFNLLDQMSVPEPIASI